jgi:lactoylglutathione lyase
MIVSRLSSGIWSGTRLLIGPTTKKAGRVFLSTTTTTTTSSSSNESITSNTRPFKVLGIQQVAIGNADKASLDALWKGVFGMKVHATKTIDSENVIEDIVKLGVYPYEVEIDLMTPIDADKSPKVHIPPLNHIGLWIDDLETAVQWMETKGVRFTPGGIRKGAAGHNVSFIHPKGSDTAPIGGAGVLVELVQAPPEVVEAFKVK